MAPEHPPKGFFKVPRALLLVRGVTHEAAVCYGVLVFFSHDGLTCWIGEERLAAELNVDVRTARRYLAKLVKAGVIKRPADDAGKAVKATEANPYHILWKAPAGEDAQSGQNCPNGNGRNQDSSVPPIRTELSHSRKPIRTELSCNQDRTVPPIRTELSRANHEQNSLIESSIDAAAAASSVPVIGNAPSAAEMEAAAAALSRSGLHPEIAQRLVETYPGAVRNGRVANWAKWLPATRRGMEAKNRRMENPERFLAKHFSGRCDCRGAACDASPEFLDTQTGTIAAPRKPAESRNGSKPESSLSANDSEADGLAWKECLKLLESTLGKEIIESWLEDCTLVELDGKPFLEAPSKTAVTWISKKYARQVLAAVLAVTGELLANPWAVPYHAAVTDLQLNPTEGDPDGH